MAKKSSVLKNNRRKKMINQFAKKRAELKKIVMNKSLPMEDRFAAQIMLSELPRNSAANRYRNRCELTGRARGTYRKFGMSRIKLRELAGFGKIPGMTKSSW